MGLHFSVQENLLPDGPIIDKWHVAEGIGFNGIELRGTDAVSFRARLPELEKAVAAGADFSSICVISDTFIGAWDADRRAIALDTMKSLLDVAGAIGANGAVTPACYGMHSNFLPPFAPERDADGDRAVLTDMLGQLGDRAEKAGTVVFVEPLNRYEDHMLNTLGQGVELLNALGHTSVKLMADMFHMNIEEADSAEAIDAAMPHVGHVHLADSNRHEPGLGHTDFAAPFAVLARHRFNGTCAIECIPSGPPDIRLPAALAHLKSAEKGA
ncbi:MAG: sugar phosphate isomerase/epimerase [Paracoccaceae bacterium]|nr:sugar phosphate isomerase/epimerase [Paracoccaceae bacterium]MDG2258572.1 sugar phosphate isomerase/epimerase [Paracoccaceae bacterium]